MLEFFKTMSRRGLRPRPLRPAGPPRAARGGNIHKAGPVNIAKCVASLVSHSEKEAVTVVQQFLTNLAQQQQDYSLTFSLLAIGEIGRGANLSKLQELKPAVLNAFNHPSEEPPATS